MTTDDTHYPHADLVKGYMARRGVKRFHVAHPDRHNVTACSIKRNVLLQAGWARGLLRQGLELCGDCAAVVDLDTEPAAPEDAE